MQFKAVKAAATGALAGLAMLALTPAVASAGVLDELRSRGLGKWVDEYVEEKNGDVQLKPSKKASLTETAADPAKMKPALKSASLPKKPKASVASLSKKTGTAKKKTTTGVAAAGSAAPSGSGTPPTERKAGPAEATAANPAALAAADPTAGTASPAAVTASGAGTAETNVATVAGTETPPAK